MLTLSWARRTSTASARSQATPTLSTSATRRSGLTTRSSWTTGLTRNSSLEWSDMPSAPLDELYYQWLYSQVGSTRLKDRTRTYWRLLKLLFTKEFVWIVPHDDNRIADGTDLRYEFVDHSRLNDVPRD